MYFATALVSGPSLPTQLAHLDSNKPSHRVYDKLVQRKCTHRLALRPLRFEVDILRGEEYP